MEFKFSVNEIFRQPIVKIGSNLLPPGFTGDRRAFWDTVGKVSEVINAMGEYSAAAQGLTKPITTAERLRNSEHTVYLLIDQNANNGRGAVTGMLKTGKKGLYVFDRNGQHYQVTPPCVLDFYIHESRQRTGLGKRLFEHMLQEENVSPVKMAIDRPSEKFLGFLNKHYSLNNPVKQMNNYVVFDDFFPSSPEKNGAVEVNHSVNTLGKKQSANGLQTSSFSSPLGRYGAPRPPCSMGQIIHNQTSTIPKNTEPTGVESSQSAPVTNYQNTSQNNPPIVNQSLPNVGQTWNQQKVKLDGLGPVQTDQEKCGDIMQQQNIWQNNHTGNNNYNTNNVDATNEMNKANVKNVAYNDQQMSYYPQNMNQQQYGQYTQDVPSQQQMATDLPPNQFIDPNYVTNNYSYQMPQQFAYQTQNNQYQNYNMPQQTIQNVHRQSMQNMPQQSMQNMPQQSMQNMPQQSMQNVPQQSIQNVPQQTMQNVPQQTIQHVPQQQETKNLTPRDVKLVNTYNNQTRSQVPLPPNTSQSAPQFQASKSHQHNQNVAPQMQQTPYVSQSVQQFQSNQNILPPIQQTYYVQQNQPTENTQQYIQNVSNPMQQAHYVSTSVQQMQPSENMQQLQQQSKPTNFEQIPPVATYANNVPLQHNVSKYAIPYSNNNSPMPQYGGNQNQQYIVPNNQSAQNPNLQPQYNNTVMPPRQHSVTQMMQTNEINMGNYYNQNMPRYTPSQMIGGRQDGGDMIQNKTVYSQENNDEQNTYAQNQTVNQSSGGAVNSNGDARVTDDAINAAVFKYGYPSQTPEPETLVKEEKGSSSPKLERPRSLSIQLSEEQTEDKKNDDVESEVPANEVEIEEEIVETLTISKDETDENEKIPLEKTPIKRTPSHLTEQGFFDLKFYHNKLW